GHPFGIEPLFAVDDRDDDDAVGQLSGRAHGLLQPLGDAGFDQQAVDHDLDGVIAALVQRDLFVERAQFAVDARAREAARPELFELLFEFAFAAAHDRREDHHAFAFGQLLDVLDDLVGGLARHGPPAVVAMRLAHRRKEQPQVIVNLGDGADGRTRAAAGGLLFYRDGGRQAFDRVDVGLFELFEELSRVSR